MTPETTAVTHPRLPILLGGAFLLAGGITLAGTISLPPIISALEAEYDYQELLVSMDNDLEAIYGTTPSDEMGFLDFIENQDIHSA
ncbi:MAG: hypothetical protein H9W81_01120 [Enterococcus sp.]|nr:hypothetical protein [Enterococcus sp.]